MDSAIIFDNISCNIGKSVILDGINLTIPQGEITGVLGQNGAGKSTLLSLVNGLRTHSSGSITLLGVQLPEKGENIRQRIGVVLQETALYEELTTFENLRFSASLFTVQNPTGRIIEVLELLKLSDRADQIVSTLSGGLRRRIAIARALLHEPELLIIDEPTLGVDVDARHAIWQHLRLLKSKGSTVIVATNYLDEAQALCSKAAVLSEGKLIAFESPDVLVARVGYCLDIECEEEYAEKIKSAVIDEKSVIRIDRTPSGVTIFLKNDRAETQIINSILKTCHIKGFHVRAPDLAEVFSSLKENI